MRKITIRLLTEISLLGGLTILPILTGCQSPSPSQAENSASAHSAGLLPTEPPSVAGKIRQAIKPSSDADTIRQAMALLAKGRAIDAEALLEIAYARPQPSPELVFLRTACVRSRFNLEEAAKGWSYILSYAPRTPMGETAACILGMDAAKNTATSLYFYSGLLAVARQNPDDTVIRWMAGVMTRALVRHKPPELSKDITQRINALGVSEYLKVLADFAPEPGPVFAHQTLANLEADLFDYPAALKHYEIAVDQERRFWSIQALARTLAEMGQLDKALVLEEEMCRLDPKNLDGPADLGYLFWRLGRYDAAIAAYQQAKPEQEATWLSDIGRNILALGRPREAQEFLTAACEKNPQDKASAVLLARIAVMTGQPEAQQSLRSAGTLNDAGVAIPWPSPAADTLLQAVRMGDLAKVRELLASTSPDAAVTPKFNQTALMLAAEYGWGEIIQELIKAGAKLDQVDSNGDTALYYASRYKQTDASRRLLAAGANPNMADKWGNTPFSKASDNYQAEILHLLIDSGRLDLTFNPPKGGPPLLLVASQASLDHVKKLLALKAPINEPNSEGYTPLMFTGFNFPRPEIARCLLDAGATVDTTDNQGRSALRLSLSRNHTTTEVADLLMERGANPDLADKQGITPIAAAHFMGYKELAERMEAKSAKPRAALPWDLPKLRPPETITIESLGDVFTLPVTLLNGLTLDPEINKNGLKQRKARELLRYQFNITGAEGFRSAFREINRFPSVMPPSNLSTSLDEDFPQMTDGWTDLVVQLLVREGATNTPSAWNQSQIIYLARLAAAAGFLPKDEAAAICKNACGTLRSAFKSWPDFTESFLLGARQNAGWDLERYAYICRLLLAQPDGQGPWAKDVWQRLLTVDGPRSGAH